MRGEKDPYRQGTKEYIPNDEIDREEKADLRQQKKGNALSVILGGVVVLSLLAFVFVLLDSGIFTSEAQRLYGSAQSAESSGGYEASGDLTQEQKKQKEEEARLAQEEAKQKKREEDAARAAEEKARKEEEERQKAEEEAAKAEEEKEAEANEYILPESNSRVYSEEELSSLSDREVLFALNEISARRGRIFTGPEFRRYFERKSWYSGTIPADEFDANQDERFNEYEKENISTLVRIAEQRGIR